MALAEQARRRVTRHLLPLLSFAYLLAYLDRANLSVAKLQMQRELGFSDEVIGLGAGVFFLGYLLLEVPGTLLVERWSARKWFARIMVSWGLLASLTGFLGTPLLGSIGLRTQFYGLRLLLGLAEAGFYPGVIVYLTHWFRQEDRSRAKAYFIVAQPLAVAFGVPLSRWILENVHWSGLAGWRWVFILEGIPPILLGTAILFLLPDWPRDARWLPPEAREWLQAELAGEHHDRERAGKTGIANGFRSRQVLWLAMIYFLLNTGNQGLIFFLPSITDSMASLSIPARTVFASLPYLLSAAGITLNGILAQRSGERRWHTAAPMLATAVSVSLVLLFRSSVALTVGFICLAGLTCQAYLPVFWTLPSSFLGKSAAATATGVINTIGNMGGFAGPFLFGSLRTRTGNFDGALAVMAGCMLVAGTMAACVRMPQIFGAAMATSSPPKQ
jgi:ACS family tartrate transporter-like MFS transporter